MSKERKEIDFVGKKKIFFMISTILIAISIIVSFFGIDIAIEFKGGTIISYSYDGDIDATTLEPDIESIVGSNVTIQQGDNLQSNTKNITISFSSNEGLTVEKQSQITDKLRENFPDANIEILDSNDVSPSAGKEFFLKCLVAVIFSAIVLIIYIAFRFKRISGWAAGVCAIIALVHDVFFVYGAFILSGFEINSNFMAVVLTILGYSVNDTIVIYDRIRENKLLMPKATISELVNKSLNQSLTRSLRTSLTTIVAMAVVSIVALIYGIDSILSFSFPLIIGMAAGTYSSMCIASQIWVWWTERKLNKDKKTA